MGAAGDLHGPRPPPQMKTKNTKRKRKFRNKASNKLQWTHNAPHRRGFNATNGQWACLQHSNPTYNMTNEANKRRTPYNWRHNHNSAERATKRWTTSSKQAPANVNVNIIRQHNTSKRCNLQVVKSETFKHTPPQHKSATCNHNPQRESATCNHNPQRESATCSHNPQRESVTCIHNPQRENTTCSHNPQRESATCNHNPQRESTTCNYNPQRESTTYEHKS